MATKKKLIQAAAGQAGGAGDLPEAVEFSTDSDYLYRNSDLSGNTDSKTFTFSGWVYAVPDIGSTAPYFYLFSSTVGTSVRFQVFSVDRYLRIYGYNSSGTLIMRLQTDYYELAGYTWNHILISCNMANSSQRHCYFNDRQIEDADFLVYTNAEIDFTTTTHAINDYNPGYGLSYPGRAAHIFLDYTYRDLTVESNRRLFVTDDLKPADGQASLSPILYLPLADADTAGTNSGTGGDFTANGTLETAQRAPNQYNCVASKFDGTDDYMTSTNIGASDSKQFTISFIVKPEAASTLGDIFNIQLGSSDANYLFGCRIRTDNYLDIFAENNNSGSTIYRMRDTTNGVYIPLGVNTHVAISVDLSDTSKRHIIVNGATVTPTYDTYTNDTIDFTSSWYQVAKRVSGTPLDGSLGELYFDNTYTDLSTDNIFWDADTNRPKPVRQVLDETGNTPLVALPISADNAQLNLGTGNNFTLNGGGMYGARGGSEFIQRSCYPATSLGYLTNNTVFSGVLNSKEMTLFFALNKRDTGNGRFLFRFDKSSSPLSTYMQLKGDQGNGDYWYFNSQNGGNILNTTSSSAVFTYDQWSIFALSVDLTSTSNRHFYKNRSSEGMNWSDYVNTNIPWSQFNRVSIFSQSSTSSSQYWNSWTGPFYLATEYIDLSDKANLNFFVDPLGYPRDLTSAIDNGDIPNPVIYLPFDDPDDFGKNLGTGGDFTVNNTLVQGADVDFT